MLAEWVCVAFGHSRRTTAVLDKGERYDYVGRRCLRCGNVVEGRFVPHAGRWCDES